MSEARADVVLVTLGLFESRARARAAIEAGLVTADGRPVRKPSETLSPGAAIIAAPAHPYVSRGGVKLAAALDAFAIDPRDRICLDVGSSTGGFTDVLLKRGAAQVIAVDTGRDQLHPSLRTEPRLVSLEGCDVRRLEPSAIPGLPALAVIDVSFISLRLVLPAVSALLAPRADLIGLVKPQFEVGKARIGKNGVVKDEAARRDALDAIEAAASALGWQVRGMIESPIAGGEGNVEYLIAAVR